MNALLGRCQWYTLTSALCPSPLGICHYIFIGTTILWIWSTLAAMKWSQSSAEILGHTDYQTTANIYTHLKSDMMKKSSVDMEEVFRRKQEAKSALAKAQTTRDK